MMRYADRRVFLSRAAALVGAAAVGGAHAQGTPIRMYQGFGPGSIPDSMGREVAAGLAERTGKSYVVENKSGASEKILASFMTQQPPDGQSLYLMTAVQAVHAATDKNIAYDVRKAFTMISSIISYPFIFTVSADSKIRKLEDLVAAAKAAPGKLTYSSPGIGSTLHLAGEMLCARAGISMTHVPYSGGDRNYYLDTASGRLDVAVGGFNQATSLSASGKLRMLAVTSAQRLPVLPDLPSVNEFYPNADVVTWLALAAPAGLPDGLRDQLSTAVRSIVARPAFKADSDRRGYIVLGSTPAELRQLLEADIAKFSKLVRDANITLS